MREGTLNAALVAYDTSAKSHGAPYANVTALEQAVNAAVAFNGASEEAAEIDYLNAKIAGYKNIIKAQARLCREQLDQIEAWANAE